MKRFMQSFIMVLWMTLITGIVYPLLVTLIAQVTMPEKANGSMIHVNGKTVGSKLIGQAFESEKYFWGRPSAHQYDALMSGGSNLGPISAKLKQQVFERKEHLLQSNSEDPIPTEMLFASGSGLDPHISLKAALFQKARIVQARGGGDAFDKQVSNLIMNKLQKRQFGFIGMPCLNVLELNLALDELQGNHG